MTEAPAARRDRDPQPRVEVVAFADVRGPDEIDVAVGAHRERLIRAGAEVLRRAEAATRTPGATAAGRPAHDPHLPAGISGDHGGAARADDDLRARGDERAGAPHLDRRPEAPVARANETMMRW